MRTRTLLVILIVPISLAMAVYGAASAQAPGVEASLTTETPELTVGDPVSLDVRVNHPPGYQVTFPRLSGTWGDFELRGQSSADTVLNLDGTQTTSQSLEVTLFEPGEFTTPDLQITVRDSAGQVFDQTVPGASLTVVSVLTDGDDQLRDIRPQASLEEPTTWPWIAGAILLVGLFGLGVYIFMRRRGALGSGITALIDSRAAHEIALEELYRIEALDLPSEVRFKEHYTLVADCVRAYLDNAYDAPALDRTTEEVRSALKSSDMAADHQNVTVGLLKDCDLVKFTRLVPDTHEARECTSRARDLVIMTVPPEPEVPPLAEAVTA